MLVHYLNTRCDLQGLSATREAATRRLCGAERGLQHQICCEIPPASLAPLRRASASRLHELVALSSLSRRSSIHIGEVGESISDLLVEMARQQSPAPVAIGLARDIHAGVAIQIEYVLCGRDGLIRDRCPRQPKQVPGNLLAPFAQIAADKPALLIGQPLK